MSFLRCRLNPIPIGLFLSNIDKGGCFHPPSNIDYAFRVESRVKEEETTGVVIFLCFIGLYNISTPKEIPH